MPRVIEMEEEQVWNLAEAELGESEDWAVVSKEEWDATESAVCLKKTKQGYILAASCDQNDAIRFFFCEERATITELHDLLVGEMKKSGNPLSGAVAI